MPSGFVRRLEVFSMGLMWAAFGAAFTAIGSVAGELFDDVRNYQGMPLDWHHVRAVAIGAMAFAVVPAVRSYVAEYKALLRLPESVVKELEEARAMRSGNIKVTTILTEEKRVEPATPLTDNGSKG